MDQLLYQAQEWNDGLEKQADYLDLRKALPKQKTKKQIKDNTVTHEQTNECMKLKIVLN